MQGKPGGSLKLRMRGDPWEWDVTSAGQSVPNVYGIDVAYSTLLHFKTGKDIGYADIQLEPSLAERWEVSKDASTYTFHLRHDVKFANLPPVNGREITAQDVKFSYEYASRTGQFMDAGLGKSQIQWIFEGLDGIETPDPYTVVVRFKQGFAPFINYAATSVNPIVPHEIYEQDGSFKNTIAGSGPFQLDTSATQKGTRWVFNKNPGYWEPGRPYLDQLIFLPIGDDASARAAYQTRQLDGDYQDDPKVMEDIKAANPGTVVFEYKTAPLHIWLNTKHPPLGDKRIREAFSLALDRDAFIQTLAGGKGEWALADSNSWADLFTQDEIKSFIKFDPERAKQLVAGAGFPDGFHVETFFPTDRGESVKQHLELLQAQERAAGIYLDLKPMPYSEASKSRRAHDFAIDSVLNEYPRPEIDAWIFASSYPGGGNNYQEIDDSKVAQLLLAQRQEPEPEKRRQILREVIRYLNENFLQIATYRRIGSIYWWPYVHNYYPHADNGTVVLKDIAKTWVDH